MTTIANSNITSSVEELFGSLLGLPVSVAEKNDAPGDANRNGFIASYGKDSESVDGLCVCDLKFANSVSAAFARIPARVAEEATKAGECPENLQENLSEILNVCSVLMRRDRNVRLALQDVYVPQSEIPDSVNTVLQSNEKTSLEVSINGYETGTLTLCAAEG